MPPSVGDGGSTSGGRRATRPAPTGWRRLGGRIWSPDGRAVLVLLGVPLVVFVGPALAGHPAIAGDNMIQNLPLRLLTGQLLRHGHLPLWNPLIWAGSPLLAGLNAGSAFPLTWVFVVLPAVPGWVINLLFVYWCAGLGCYALLRAYRLDPLPSALGASVYAFSGAMAGQMVHIQIVQGMAIMPLMVLAELRLAQAVLGSPAVRGAVSSRGSPPPSSPRPRVPSPWPWTFALTGLLALVLLTGEPRSMAEAEIVASVVALYVLLRRDGGVGRLDGSRFVPPLALRARLLGHLALAAAWAVAIAAVQLLPGLSFITASQRADETLGFFGSGSLQMSWTSLMLVPNLFGGDGFLHQPVFFNTYNLPEVTGYVGLLPLVAAFALFTRSFGRSADPRRAQWGLWLILLVLGMLLAWGTFTPLGHVFGDIPFFGKTRLQSRNLGIVDLALAVLLAFWAQRALVGGSEAAGLAGWRRWVTLVPVAAAATLLVVAIALPGPLEAAFDVRPDLAYLGRYLTPWFVAFLVVAVVLAGLLLGWRRLGATARRRALTGLVLVEVVLFNASSASGLAPGNTTVMPNRATAVSVLGDRGRFAMVDPAINTDALSQLGSPDLNVYTGLPSAQGYGSLVTGTYDQVTGTHYLDTLDSCALRAGLFRQLRLATLLVAPETLAPKVAWAGTSGTPAGVNAAEDAQNVLNAQGAGGTGSDFQTPCPGAPPPGSPSSRTWYLGRAVPVSSATLVPAGAAASALLPHQPPRLGLVGTDGSVRWPAERLRQAPGGGWTVELARPETASGLVVHGPARLISDASTVTDAAGNRYQLDGDFQDALGSSAWRLTGLWGSYSRFEAVKVLPPLWLARPTPGASVRRVSISRTGDEVDEVVAPRPVEVVRSEAASPGWSVRAVPRGGGPARQLSVTTVGLVQGVEVPAGDWTLVFSYWAPRLSVGLGLSALGVVALAAAGAGWLVTRRRRRRPDDSARRSAPLVGAGAGAALTAGAAADTRHAGDGAARRPGPRRARPRTQGDVR